MSDPPDAPPAPWRAARPLKVLIVEDSPVNQRLLQAILKHRGHTSAVASDGREALAALEREAFDILLLDIHMEGMDGFETAAAIRAREASSGAHLPIVATTGSAGPEDRERCRAAGMDGYLAKPFRPDELVELVESMVGEGSLPRPSAGESGALDSAAENLRALFFTDALGLCAEMGGALARQDGPALERLAHRLSGSAAYFVAGRALELARQLEELGREGDFSAATHRAHQELGLVLARLERQLGRSAGAGSRRPRPAS